MTVSARNSMPARHPRASWPYADAVPTEAGRSRLNVSNRRAIFSPYTDPSPGPLYSEANFRKSCCCSASTFRLCVDGLLAGLS